MNRLIVVLAALGLALPSLAASRQRYTIVTDTAPSAVVSRIATNADKAELRMRTFRNVNGFAASLTEEEAAALRATPGVSAVDPVVERHASSVGKISTNLASYATQVTPWGLPKLHADQVWPVTKGEGINVVVMDTGIDYTHPDLKAAYVGGTNILDATATPMDDHFHGTHVAGTIAATNNSFGIVGVAPGVKLWALKALDAQGKGFDEGIAAGLDWVMSKQKELGGRWVVNMSFGSGAEGGTLERKAAEKAIAENIVLVAAAGNGGSYHIDYPGAYPGVIPVGAVGQDGKRAEFSAYGGHMAIVAPGVALESTLPENHREDSDITIGDQVFHSRGTIGSPKTSMTGRLVYCGLGRPGEFPVTVRDNIALIDRGDNAFREKSRNAKEAGAKGVVIMDNVADIGLKPFTLLPAGCPGPDCGDEWNNYAFPLTVNVTYEDGVKLKALALREATVAYEWVRYGPASGTSMAAPHVASVAALLLSLDPTLTPSDVLKVLRDTAQDTNEEGWDYETAWGIVDALAAAQFVAPAKFNVPPPPPSSRRRSSRP